MFFAAFTLILPARGMAGGTSSGVTYFGMPYGLCVPPGIAAWSTCRIPPIFVDRYRPPPAAAPILTNSRRVGLKGEPKRLDILRRSMEVLLPTAQTSAWRTVVHRKGLRASLTQGPDSQNAAASSGNHTLMGAFRRVLVAP